VEQLDESQSIEVLGLTQGLMGHVQENVMFAECSEFLSKLEVRQLLPISDRQQSAEKSPAELERISEVVIGRIDGRVFS